MDWSGFLCWPLGVRASGLLEQCFILACLWLFITRVSQRQQNVRFQGVCVQGSAAVLGRSRRRKRTPFIQRGILCSINCPKRIQSRSWPVIFTGARVEERAATIFDISSLSQVWKHITCSPPSATLRGASQTMLWTFLRSAGKNATCQPVKAILICPTITKFAQAKKFPADWFFYSLIGAIKFLCNSFLVGNQLRRQNTFRQIGIRKLETLKWTCRLQTLKWAS